MEVSNGFTLAQKMVGRACGLAEGQGIVPGQYCEPKMTTVGSQDTTGPMTRDELKDLACKNTPRNHVYPHATFGKSRTDQNCLCFSTGLGFSADLVMQSFCHTAAYPKPVDVVSTPLQTIARRL